MTICLMRIPGTRRYPPAVIGQADSPAERPGLDEITGRVIDIHLMQKFNDLLGHADPEELRRYERIKAGYRP